MRLTKNQFRRIVKEAHYLTVDGILHVVAERHWHQAMGPDEPCLLARHVNTGQVTEFSRATLGEARVISLSHRDLRRPCCGLKLNDARMLEFYVRKPLDFTVTPQRN
jgi:hypothetical protein